MATAAEIAVSYDVGNDFFRAWLDERMNYSGAVYERPDQSLEDAQMNKLRLLHDRAHAGPSSHVLDIGCGWGANLQRLSERGIRGHGITLSKAQLDELVRRQLPGISLTLTGYEDFQPAERFDAVISIEMFEHIATPLDVRDGRHMDIFRGFFRRAHAWTKPGAWFALQTTLLNRVPRDPKHLRDMAVATRTILPGSKCARLEDVILAVSPWWEIMEVETYRESYARTSAEWLRRLRAAEPRLRAQYGDRTFDDYAHYLATCEQTFANNYSTLAHLSMRRCDGATT
jgi:cyclopropane-fatty-acyl-phospholipid synthase